MIILSLKKTHVVLSAGENIVEYNGNSYIDTDTNVIYQKSLVNFFNIDEVISDEVMFNPSKFLFEDGKLIENPYYKEQYTFSEDTYSEIQANIDYLMLLNDPDSTTEETA